MVGVHLECALSGVPGLWPRLTIKLSCLYSTSTRGRLCIDSTSMCVHLLVVLSQSGSREDER